MDYAYAPGGTRYDREMRSLLGERPDTTLLHDPFYRSLADFVSQLSVSGSITRPVQNILIASHGSSSGQLRMVLYEDASSRTTYEEMQTAVDYGHLEFLPEALQPPASPTPSILHIKGCKLGQSPVMMSKLKEAFGPHLHSLTAPKHFHAIKPKRSHGHFELLAYTFNFFQKSRNP